MHQPESQRIPPRLHVVGQLLAEGKNNQEIADSLTVTLHTAEKYVSDLKKTLQARDRVDLVKKCEQLGSQLP